MSAKMLSWAFKLPRSINRGLRAVLVAMADHASDDGVCWPGIVGLADKTALSDRMVQLMIRKAQGIELVPGKALVTVEARKRDNGSAASNVYVLNLPEPPKERPARVIVSYYDHALLSTMYPGWTVRRLKATKALVSAGRRDNRGRVDAPEVLLINGPSLVAGDVQTGGLYGGQP